MAQDSLDTRITRVLNELNKKGNWAFKNVRTLMLLEKDIRLNVKRFIDDPVGYDIGITSGKLKALTSKLKNKMLKIVDSDVILDKLNENTLIDDKVFNATLKPYLDLYFPFAEQLLILIVSLTYITVALETHERQDGNSCVLGAAILSAVKEA